MIQVVETALIALFGCPGKDNKPASTVTATANSTEGLRTTLTLELVSDRPCQKEQFRSLVVQQPRMKEFLSDGVAALQIEDVKGDICSAGSTQGVVLTLKPTAALSGDSLQKLLDELQCHFHRLYLTHPWICFEIKERCSANGTFKCWSYPEVGNKCKTAKVGQRHRIAASDTYYSDTGDTVKHVQPLSGSHYSLRSRWEGDKACDCHISACVFTVPHLRLAKRHRQKRLPADFFLAQVKVLAYGPGGLPVWCGSVASQHMADCVAEWSQFGVSLVPPNNGPDGVGGWYDVHSEREDSRIATPGRRRLLVLMLFLDLPENHSAISKLSFVDELRARAGEVLTHCSSRLKMACHSALNKLLFNYSRETELTSAVSEALPCLSAAVAAIIGSSDNEQFKANCYKLLKVEDDTKGGQDELSACILQSLQKLAQMSVTFAKATPPQARRDGDAAGVHAPQSQTQVQQSKVFVTKVQSQANVTQSSNNKISADRNECTPKAFKSYLCHRYARKRAQENETTSIVSPTKLTEAEQPRQSCQVSVVAMAGVAQSDREASMRTDFDDLESWAHHSPNVLDAGSDSICVVGVEQRPHAEVSPPAGEEASQSILPPLTRLVSEQEPPLPAPAGSVSPPESVVDWEEDLDTLLFDEDGSVCSCSDETDVALSPGDVTFSSELEMDTDMEVEDPQPLQLMNQECDNAAKDPLQTTPAADLGLQICGSVAPPDTETPDRAVPDTETPDRAVPRPENAILDDFDCLDGYAFFDEEESQALLNRHTKVKGCTAPNCSSVQNTQWSEFDDVQENDFQW